MTTESATEPRTTDPRTAEPRPEDLADMSIAYPGRTAEMQSEPDHGEESYVGSGRLTGRRALVTGGDSGIGRAVCLAFAREGADVAFTYLPDEAEDAAATTALIEGAGRRALAVEVDLRDEAACRALVTRTVSELGGLEVLVSNAAFQMAQPEGLAAISSEQLERTLTTNVSAMFWLVQEALPHLRAGASIICTSSVQAFEPSPQLLDYAVTKSAILAFTRGLSQQLAERGIRVNAVCPGPVWTPLIPATMPEGKVESFGSDTPLGRAAQPAELAPAYVYYASDASSYVTGDRIVATGGRLV